jgi:hypothetical protein
VSAMRLNYLRNKFVIAIVESLLLLHLILPSAYPSNSTTIPITLGYSAVIARVGKPQIFGEKDYHFWHTE